MKIAFLDIPEVEVVFASLDVNPVDHGRMLCNAEMAATNECQPVLTRKARRHSSKMAGIQDPKSNLSYSAVVELVALDIHRHKDDIIFLCVGWKKEIVKRLHDVARSITSKRNYRHASQYKPHAIEVHQSRTIYQWMPTLTCVDFFTYSHVALGSLDLLTPVASVKEPLFACLFRLVFLLRTLSVLTK